MAYNEQNLKPFAMLSEEEQRAIRSKGGKASVEKRRQAKTMSEMAKYVLSCPLNDIGKQKLKRLGADVDDSNPTVLMAMIVGQSISAVNGNQKSAEWVQKLIGEQTETEGNASAFLDALNGTVTKEDSDIEE